MPVLKKQVFDEASLCMYRNSITKNIVFNYISTLSKKYYNSRLISSGFHRDAMMNDFKKWIAHNSNKFYG